MIARTGEKIWWCKKLWYDLKNSANELWREVDVYKSLKVYDEKYGMIQLKMIKEPMHISRDFSGKKVYQMTWK